LETPGPELPTPSRSRLAEVALYFTKLGFTAFGGPAAHLAMMEEQLVKKRKWLDRRHFLDLLAAINFIPGPNSTQMAINLGYVRAGFPGLIVAGVCFIVPAMLIILPIAWFYVIYQHLPQTRGILSAVNAVVVGIVVAALVRFAKTGLRDGFGIVVAIVSAIASLLSHRHQIPAGDVVILAAAGVAGAIWYGPKGASATPMLSLALPVIPLAAGALALGGIAIMALLFLKIGATLFGSGYMLLPYLQSSFCEQYHWLSQEQVASAIAVGQVTPGPLLTTATFVGFILGYGYFGGGLSGGILGGVAATAAIFLPSFIFIAILGAALPKIRQNPKARGALDAMNAAVVALIGVAAILLAQNALSAPPIALSVAISLASLALLLIWNVNSTWLILAAIFIGWARVTLLH
jgi:chromate transporter